MRCTEFVLVACLAISTSACDPCQLSMEKLEQCRTDNEDREYPINTDQLIAGCRVELEDMSRGDREDTNCLLSCFGTASNCIRFYERRDYTCECDVRCPR
jgi:hypothetical protein